MTIAPDAASKSILASLERAGVVRAGDEKRARQVLETERERLTIPPPCIFGFCYAIVLIVNPNDGRY